MSLSSCAFYQPHPGRLVKLQRTTTFRHCSKSLPQIVEPTRCCSGVVGRVTRVSVAKAILNQTEIASFVRQGEAAGVAERVGVDPVQARALTSACDDVVHGLSGKRLLAFGDEEPGQGILPARQPALDCPKLVPGDRLFDAATVLPQRNPEPRLAEVHVAKAQPNRLGYAEAVAEHHQDQEVVADAMATLLRRCEKPIDVLLT